MRHRLRVPKMDEAAINTLPIAEQKSVWYDTERNFWRSFERDNEASLIDAEEQYQMETAELKAELATLSGEGTQLAATRDRVLRELNRVEEELSNVATAFDKNITELTALQNTHRNHQLGRVRKQAQIARSMETYFSINRRLHQNSPLGGGREPHSKRTVDSATIYQHG